MEITIPEELKKEGLAREIVRRIQNQRKIAGFSIPDQIEIYYDAGSRLTEVFTAYGDYIATETLSVSTYKAEPPKGSHVTDFKIDGEPLRLGLVCAQKYVDRHRAAEGV